MIALDASVSVKWVIEEQHTDRAIALLAASLRDPRGLIAPPHFTGEVTNAIYQRWRSTDPAKHLNDAQAGAALARFLTVEVDLLNPPNLAMAAFDFARARRLPSIYDSIYVVLAQQMDCELWTADRRLLDALGTGAPWVRFIGDFPLSGG